MDPTDQPSEIDFETLENQIWAGDWLERAEAYLAKHALDERRWARETRLMRMVEL